MTVLSKTAAAIALAIGVAATATPAAAVVTTFAQYTAIGSGANLRWQNSSGTSNGTGGSLYTTATSTANSPGSRLVSFSFLQPQLAAVATNVNAIFTLNASVPNGNKADLFGSFLLQDPLAGSFSFISTTAITINNKTYGAGSNLLTGTFTNAAIAGQRRGTSGSVGASTSGGSTITYTSDFLDFSETVSRDFSLALTSIASPLQAVPTSGTPTRALRTFRALSTGSFSSDPAPIITAVPEPATWGLMVLGFGMVGFAARRRSTPVAA